MVSPLPALLTLAGLLALALGGAAGSSGDQQCQKFLLQYLEKRGGALSQEQDPSKMLFFLHVPRTAGKTYYTCFLKSAYPPSQRCARAYDRLRLNISVPTCTLLSSHDDMSISDLFHPGGAVITQLRKPLDRVLSAYEFAIDVAVRHLHMSQDEIQEAMDDATSTSTLTVWPWSQLVPWFRADMRRRTAALERAHDEQGLSRWLSFKDKKNRTYYWSKASNKSVWELPDPSNTLDPYNNPLVTPLHEFIELPVAQELVHNTAGLQILGLTNYSIWPEHQLGRRCLFEDPITHDVLRGVALRRLVGMKHVGITERLDESVLSLAATLGLKLSGPSYKYASASAFSYDEEGLDESTPITYNSSYHGGNVTVTLHEARWRLKRLSHRLVNVTEELRIQLPRLLDIAEKEDAWLDQQAAANSGGGGGSVAAGAGNGKSNGNKVAAGKGEVEERGSGRDEGEVEAGDEEEDTAGEVGGASGGGADADDEGAGDDDSGSKSAPTVAHRILKSSTRQLPRRRRRRRRQQGPEHPTSTEEEQQQEQQIDSPYAKEIEALDEEVSKMQSEVKFLEWDMWAIQNAGAIRHSDDALGPARQVLPDEHFKHTLTLGASYKHCTSSTSKRHSAGRHRVFKRLATPSHESFAFSKRSRKSIPQAVLDRIVELNSVDQELWELGERLLTAKVAEQREAGVLESLERPKPAHLQRQQETGGAEDRAGGATAQTPLQGSGSNNGSSRSSDDGGEAEAGSESHGRDEL